MAVLMKAETVFGSMPAGMKARKGLEIRLIPHEAKRVRPYYRRWMEGRGMRVYMRILDPVTDRVVGKGSMTFTWPEDAEKLESGVTYWMEW